MSPTPSYEEIVDFIASGTTPESVEQAELGDYLQLEHLLILAKARGRQKLLIAS
jgi:hypothetical protein